MVRSVVCFPIFPQKGFRTLDFEFGTLDSQLFENSSEGNEDILSELKQSWKG